MFRTTVNAGVPNVDNLTRFTNMPTIHHLYCHKSGTDAPYSWNFLGQCGGMTKLPRKSIGSQKQRLESRGVMGG